MYINSTCLLAERPGINRNVSIATVSGMRLISPIDDTVVSV